MVKKLQRSWGFEIVVGVGCRVVRIYSSSKKVTLDLSQIRDDNWTTFQKVQAKYPNTRKIELPPEPTTDINRIIEFWLGGLK